MCIRDRAVPVNLWPINKEVLAQHTGRVHLLQPAQMRIGFQPAGAHIQMILYMLIHQFCHAPGDSALFPAAVLMIHLKTSGLAVCAGVGVDGNGKIRLVSIEMCIRDSTGMGNE